MKYVYLKGAKMKSSSSNGLIISFLLLLVTFTRNCFLAIFGQFTGNSQIFI